MTAWVFEALHCPTLPNENKKTKLQIYTETQAGINILLAPVPLLHFCFVFCHKSEVLIVSKETLKKVTSFCRLTRLFPSNLSSSPVYKFELQCFSQMVKVNFQCLIEIHFVVNGD
jgi:hypothetical protein